MCKNSLCNEKFKELGEFIDNMTDKKGALIEVLHKAQNIFGYLPCEVQEYISDKLDIPVSKIYGVVNFYSYFTMKPKGENVVNVCLGTACFVRGAANVLSKVEKKLGIKAGETTSDGKFTIDILRCVGACGLAPVMTINDKVYGNIHENQVDKIIDEYVTK